MNNIEITEEQKEKLIEMSTKLFVGTKVGEWNIEKILMCDQKGSCHGHSSKENQIFVYISTTMGFSINIIHWFEFVITHLTTKIYNLRQPSTTITLMRGHTVQDGHPIDLLYEQFKKIK